MLILLWCPWTILVGSFVHRRRVSNSLTDFLLVHSCRFMCLMTSTSELESGYDLWIKLYSSYLREAFLRNFYCCWDMNVVKAMIWCWRQSWDCSFCTNDCWDASFFIVLDVKRLWKALLVACMSEEYMTSICDHSPSQHIISSLWIINIDLLCNNLIRQNNRHVHFQIIEHTTHSFYLDARRVSVS